MKPFSLVLGGGGAFGFGWEAGVLKGILQNNIEFLKAAEIIATSSGAMLAAQIRNYDDLEIIEKIIAKKPEASTQKPAFDFAGFKNAINELYAKFGQDSRAIRAAIGAKAIQAATMSETEWKESIRNKMIPVEQWPSPNLFICCVDANTGKLVLFRDGQDILVIDAAIASCSVPMLHPPVTINGNRYMDGGIRSSTNADVVSASNKVIIINPQPVAPSQHPMSGSNIHTELKQLYDQGCEAYVISPDEKTLALFFQKILDPSLAAIAFEKGLEDGKCHADKLHEFLKK